MFFVSQRKWKQSSQTIIFHSDHVASVQMYNLIAYMSIVQCAIFSHHIRMTDIDGLIILLAWFVAA